MGPFTAAGYAGSCLVFAAFGMRSLIPLRAVALLSNVAFLTYGLGMDLAPVWALHAALLPMNLWRLWEQLHPAGLPSSSVESTLASSPV